MLGNKLDRANEDEGETSSNNSAGKKGSHENSKEGTDEKQSLDEQSEPSVTARVQELEKQLLSWCVEQAKKHKIEISFMLVSAKTGQNINQAFQCLARRILMKRQDLYQKQAAYMMSTSAGDQRSNEDPNSGSNKSGSAGRQVSDPTHSFNEMDFS